MADYEQRAMTGETAEALYGRGSLFEPLPFTSEDVRREVNRRRRHRGGRVFLVVLAILLAVLAIVLALMFNVTHSLKTVSTSAMEPTLSPGQVVYVQKADDVEGNDVVVVRQSSGDEVFTRIIACPGEWVGVTDNGQLAVSDQEIAKGALLERGDSSGTIALALQLPDSTYLIAGDATAVSEDLLLSSQNYIAANQITGQVLYKVWPPYALGSV